MNTTAIIGLVVTLLPQVLQLWNSTSGNTLTKIATFLKGAATGPELQAIETWAATQFPQVGKDLQAAAAFLVLAQQHAGIIYWLQEGLNLAQSLNIVQFNGGNTPGNNPLRVDGKYGPRTQAALMALQKKFGLPSTGVLSDEENAILTAISANGLAGAVKFIFDSLIAKITGKAAPAA